MRRRFYGIALLIFASIYGAMAQKYNKAEVVQDRVIPGQVVVKMKPGFTFGSTATARTSSPLASLGFNVEVDKPFKQSSNTRRASRSGIDFSSYYKLKFGKDIDVSKVISAVSEMEGVEYVEPLYIHEMMLTPNDEAVEAQYYLDLVNAFEAWDITTGSSDIVVAVIDSGIDYEHEDLDDKIYLNDNEIPDNGIDDDGDGYIDNYLGWDFVGGNADNVLPDNDPMNKNSDDRAHGTWVAGIIAAETNNEEGIASVGYNTKYMALKCGEDEVAGSRSIFFATDAVIYAADHGADVINMSYGGPTYSQFAQDVMTYAAIEKDVVLVAAAGNSGVEQPEYPAAYDHVISVAATDDRDIKANFSTYDVTVDISAPGVGIFTTSPKQEYSSRQGTSFSSPIVAGAAALLRAHYPDYDQFQIGTLLIQSGDLIDDINNDFKGKLGIGRLNIANALELTTPALRIESSGLVNSNGVTPIAGESAKFSLSVINKLDVSSSNAKVIIDTINNNPLDFEKIEVSLSSLATNEIQSFDSLFSINLPESIPFYQNLDFSVIIEDPDFDYTLGSIVSFVVNPLKTESKIAPYLLADGGDFESNLDDFQSAALSGGIDIWELGEPQNTLNNPNSGSKVWKTGLENNLPEETFISVLQSPVFDLSDPADYRLSFYKSMEVRYCNLPYAVQVQYSVDGGLHWQTLGDYRDPRGTNWYNKGSGLVGCELDPILFDDQKGWIGSFENEFTEYNISDLSGNDKIVFRFVIAVIEGASSDGYLDGFMLDDFQIIKEPAKAEFIPSSIVSYINTPITFEYLSNGQSSIEWDFGDGQAVSGVESPSYAFSEEGVYEVTLTIENSEGTDTKSIEIIILPELDANFTLNDGGDLESDNNTFGIDNISGTPFELGNSTIAGKDGTSSGSFAFVTGLNEEEYQDDSEAYIYTSIFDFSIVGNYSFNFSSNYSFEEGWDGFIIEFSLNKGETWKKLKDELAENWYNSESEGSVFPEGSPIFSGSTEGEFREFSTDISNLSGNKNVSFRFKFLTDANTVDVGAAIDDIFITAPVAGPIEAGFTTSSESNCVGEEITFVNASTGSITAITWDFGEGADPATANGPGPHTVVYESPGTKSVSITASNDSESDVETLDIVVGEFHEPFIENIGLTREGFVILQASEGDAYRWYLNNELVEDANERIYNAPEDGNYTAEVSVDGCFQFAENVIRTVTGLENIQPLDLHPNPTFGELKIDGNIFSFSILKVQIYDLSGKINSSRTIDNDGGLISIDASTLESGIYFLHVEDGKNNWVGRFIKK